MREKEERHTELESLIFFRLDCFKYSPTENLNNQFTQTGEALREFRFFFSFLFLSHLVKNMAVCECNWSRKRRAVWCLKLNLEDTLQAIRCWIFGQNTFQKLLQCCQCPLVQYLHSDQRWKWKISRMSLFVVNAMHLYRHKLVFELHLPLLGIQHLLVFSFLGGVCVRWKGDHAVHTHFEQVKTFILTQRRLQWAEEEAVKDQILGRWVGNKMWRIFIGQSRRWVVLWHNLVHIKRVAIQESEITTKYMKNFNN